MYPSDVIVGASSCPPSPVVFSGNRFTTASIIESIWAFVITGTVSVGAVASALTFNVAFIPESLCPGISQMTLTSVDTLPRSNNACAPASSEGVRLLSSTAARLC